MSRYVEGSSWWEICRILADTFSRRLKEDCIRYWHKASDSLQNTSTVHKIASAKLRMFPIPEPYSASRGPLLMGRGDRHSGHREVAQSEGIRFAWLTPLEEERHRGARTLKSPRCSCASDRFLGVAVLLGSLRVFLGVEFASCGPLSGFGGAGSVSNGGDESRPRSF